MRRALVGVLLGLGLAGGGLAIAAPPRAASLYRSDADAGRLQRIETQSPELRSKVAAAGQRLLSQMDDEGATADAGARRLAELLAEELAKAGTPADAKTVEALAAAIAGQAGSAATALAMMITGAIAELSYIERCDAAKDCAADPAKQGVTGVTASGVKKMRERIAAEKTTARLLLASERAALAKVTKKRARIEAALPALAPDAGAAR